MTEGFGPGCPFTPRGGRTDTPPPATSRGPRRKEKPQILLKNLAAPLRCVRNMGHTLTTRQPLREFLLCRHGAIHCARAARSRSRTRTPRKIHDGYLSQLNPFPRRRYRRVFPYGPSEIGEGSLRLLPQSIVQRP